MSSNVFLNNQLERIADYIDAGKAGGGSLTVNLSGVGDMTGASAGTAGVHGLVPAPAAGDQDKVLTGAGTWETPPSGGGMPDYSNPIISGNYNQPGTVYTATQDCFIYLEYSYIGTPCYIDVDGATVARLWTSNGQSQSGSLIPLKAGNVVTSHGGNDTLPYAVYPII
jgi:hypothetical protein